MSAKSTSTTSKAADEKLTETKSADPKAAETKTAKDETKPVKGAEKPAKADDKKAVKEEAKTSTRRRAASPKKTEKAEKAEKAPKAEKSAKAELKPEVYLQYAEKEAATDQIIDRIKDAWVADGHRVSSIKSLKVYVKPEEEKAYYVINDNKFSGDVDLF